MSRLGVVLFQLGGPDTLDAIEPFLYNLFCDPDIIDFPFARIGRKPLAKLISTARAKKVQHHYAVIGNGSPIRRHTEQQARSLESELRRRLGEQMGRAGSRGLFARAQSETRSPQFEDAVCAVAMRYWHPFTSEAVDTLEAAGCDQYVLLPLYPQYSFTTTGSSLNEWTRVLAHRGLGRQCHTINDFYKNELYLQAVVERVNEALARMAHDRRPTTNDQRPTTDDRRPMTDEVELVFSAHSTPVAVVERGDPYQQQIEETVALVLQRGRWPLRHRLCYQSKVGASKWLQPSLRTTIRELGAEGVKRVCVVPISFVSDHVETLGEIDHEARELAGAAGIEQFEMAAGLNDSPLFIAALAQLVVQAAGIEVEDERLIAAD
jgi:ferrochelatase